MGDSVLFDDLRITIEKVFKKRITRIKLVKVEKPERERVDGGKKD